MLAPPFRVRGAGVAAVDAAPTGYAVAWSERAGDREALRFLAVDRDGAPRSPSAEVVDRQRPLSAPSIHAEADGYSVAWREDDGAQFSRKLDPKGRARADVAAASADPVAAGVSRCALVTNALRCTAPDGHVMDLAAGEHVVTETSVDGRLALVSSGPDGLRLWLLDCATAR